MHLMLYRCTTLSSRHPDWRLCFLFQGGQWCVAALCVPALRLSLALLERSFCDVDRAAFEPLHWKYADLLRTAPTDEIDAFLEQTGGATL